MKKLLYLLIAFIGLFACFSSGVNAQGIGINASGNASDSSAMLDVNSTTKGVLISRMSISQMNVITNPATGLLIYNTDCNNFYYYNGASWVALNEVKAGVSIAASPGGAICAGNTVTFTATAVNGGTSPAYQWKVNGSNVGTNSSTYTYNPANADVVDCILTSNAPCVASTQVTSNTITMVVNPVPAAAIVYLADPYCSDAGTATVTLTGTTGGTFSSTAGLSINPVSGSINLGSSTGGTYTVTYTIAAAGGCPQVVTTTPVTVTTKPVATFSYTGTPYCGNAANPLPAFSGGGVAGTFSSTAGLVFVSTSTGQVNLMASTPGSYTVTNTIAAAGGCAVVTATSPITIVSYVSSPQVFAYTGAMQTFTVPCGTTSITIDAFGAQGCCGGGLGGEAKGSYAVTPGQVLNIFVGGKGDSPSNGWNGGGLGNSGGGGSDVRVGGTALTNRIIVAGGGGGGYTGGTYPGGAGGGNIGGTGGSGGANGGTGGSQVGGGAGGSGCYSAGTSGSLGQGGVQTQGGGCGGGGGYYGGGGGGYCNSPWGAGGGGGGSNYLGGVTSISNLQGIQSGNGQVTITY